MATTELPLLLDTHAFLWAIFEPQRLSKRVRGWLLNTEANLFLSVASVWEIEIKHRKGKLRAEPSIVDAKMQELGIHALAITLPHIRALATFSDIAHSDPFDRLIAAQALMEGLTLVTADLAFAAFSQVKVRW